MYKIANTVAGERESWRVRIREPVMWKADEEEQQSSTSIVREVVIMYFKKKYPLYNVHSLNSHVALENLLNLLNKHEMPWSSVMEPTKPGMFKPTQQNPILNISG